MAIKKELPDRYYLAHFNEFLAFFDGPSKCLLRPVDSEFIDDFKCLNSDSQCIVVRAANRKYPVVATKTFDYAEITAPYMQLDKLTVQGWFLPIGHASANEIAAALTKADLQVLLADYGVTLSASKSKAEFATALATLLSKHPLENVSDVENRYLYRRFDDVLGYLLFLYFGHTKGRLNQFSMRDLGVMRTRKDAAGQSARFSTLSDATAAYFYASQRVKWKQDIAKESVIDESVLANLPEANCPLSQEYRDGYLYTLGCKVLTHNPVLGLLALSIAQSDNAREKWLRESYKAGNKEAVRVELESLIDDPPSDTFLAFAEDFYQRKFGKKRTSELTDMLRQASRSLLLDESFMGNVESGVIADYRRQGLQACKTENRLWRTLFGLTFWDLLYSDNALVTEFDRRPELLRENRFFAAHHDEITQRIKKYFCDADNAIGFLTSQAARYYGKVNGLFIWHQALLDPCVVLLKYGSIASIQQMLLMMSKDIKSFSDGFPDIMVVEDGQLRFEEIKAPGDQLRRNQLVSIRGMRQAGFEVAITQVNWYHDPNQPYVVVDIETTGGRAEHHRITEVGMVKLVAGKEVDRWQSLINPERHIPHAITRLTGISDEMVADAPRFESVAEDIDAFTQDCVFVAHNVNFDYGFMRHEFARIGKSFKRPKFCTVAQMRKAKPGLSSYSLKALTQHFSIELVNHHRALADAEAAAELLRIIQGANE